MNAAEYSRWLAVARRYSRRRGEAEDLLQDALLAAVRTGRAGLASAADCAWMTGVLRNRAGADARSAVRRRRREGLVATGRLSESRTAHDSEDADAMAAELPRSIGMVMAMPLHGMTRPEIAWALDVTDEALRQRISRLRRACAGKPVSGRTGGAARPHLYGAELVMARRALLAWSRRSGSVGTHDPDGHLIAISMIRKSRSGGLR